MKFLNFPTLWLYLVKKKGSRTKSIKIVLFGNIEILVMKIEVFMSNDLSVRKIEVLSNFWNFIRFDPFETIFSQDCSDFRADFDGSVENNYFFVRF